MSTLRFTTGVGVRSSGAKRATLGWACEEAATLCAQVGHTRSRRSRDRPTLNPIFWSRPASLSSAVS